MATGKDQGPRFAAVAAMAAAVVAGVTGCGSSEADPGSVTQAPATSTVATTASSDVPPAAAQKNTKEGAVAFLRWYYGAVNKAYATLDTSVLRSYSTEQCAPCRIEIRQLDGYKAKGYRFKNDLFSLPTVQFQQLESESTDTVLSVRSLVLANTLLDSSGKTVETGTREFATYNYRLRWAGDRWLATDTVESA